MTNSTISDHCTSCGKAYANPGPLVCDQCLLTEEHEHMARAEAQQARALDDYLEGNNECVVCGRDGTEADPIAEFRIGRHTFLACHNGSDCSDIYTKQHESPNGPQWCGCGRFMPDADRVVWNNDRVVCRECDDEATEQERN